MLQPCLLATFFPNLPFGWIFYLALVGLMATAAYGDLRETKIRNWLTLTIFLVGLTFNVVRGGLLGASGSRVWHFEEPGVALGMLDGLLFALEGCAAGFAFFFLMWILNSCGAGDVKLFSAVAACVGPVYLVGLLIGTYAILVSLGAAYLLKRFFRRGLSGLVLKSQPAGAGKRRGKAAKDPAQAGMAVFNIRLAYAFPLSLSVALVLLWLWRVDLGLVIRPQ